jgi:RNA recognition motif-containing protein
MASAKPRAQGYEGVFEMRIYVENLLHDATEENLQQAFEPFGQVISAELVKDIVGRSKGVGFVEMPVDAEAQAAIGGLDGQALKGRIMIVHETAPCSKGQQYFEYL